MLFMISRSRRNADSPSRCAIRLASLATATLVVACSGSTDVSGTWQGVSAARGGDNDLIYGPDGQGVGLRLILGEYGPDLAGVLQFYTSANFDRSRSATSPDFECACNYLHGGRIDAVSARISFTLLGCTPGSATGKAQRLRGSFVLTQQGRLDGTLRVDDPTSLLNGKSVAVQLDRLAQSSEVEPSDLVCRQPPDAANGNIFSGR